MIDVGVGVERELGISKEKMKQAPLFLEMEGYKVYGGGVPQATNPGKQTNIRSSALLALSIKKFIILINQFCRDYVSHDGGETFDTFVYQRAWIQQNKNSLC
jgi:hypothetical protein